MTGTTSYKGASDDGNAWLITQEAPTACWRGGCWTRRPDCRGGGTVDYGAPGRRGLLLGSASPGPLPWPLSPWTPGKVQVRRRNEGSE